MDESNLREAGLPLELKGRSLKQVLAYHRSLVQEQIEAEVRHAVQVERAQLEQEAEQLRKQAIHRMFAAVSQPYNALSQQELRELRERVERVERNSREDAAAVLALQQQLAQRDDYVRFLERTQLLLGREAEAAERAAASHVCDS